MPKGSKKVAARQGALSTKKKRADARPAAAYAAPAAAPMPSESPPSQPVTPAGAQDLPEFQAPPQRASAPSIALPGRPQPAASAAQVKRPLPQMPYFKADLRAIGLLAVGLIVGLIILDFAIS